MKNILKLSLLSIIFAFASCKDDKTESVDKENTETAENQLYSCSMHPASANKEVLFCMRYGIDRVTTAAVVPEEVMSQVEPLSKSSFSVDEVLNNYLKLKCTYKDDSKEAANAARIIYHFNI
jgi:hypothetical protein